MIENILEPQKLPKNISEFQNDCKTPKSLKCQNNSKPSNMIEIPLNDLKLCISFRVYS